MFFMDRSTILNGKSVRDRLCRLQRQATAVIRGREGLAAGPNVAEPETERGSWGMRGPAMNCRVRSFRMVPGAGIEPARLAAGDFESPASTNFTTRAGRGGRAPSRKRTAIIRCFSCPTRARRPQANPRAGAGAGARPPGICHARPGRRGSCARRRQSRNRRRWRPGSCRCASASRQPA